MQPLTTLAKLADREAIGQLPALYCHYVRTQNLDELLNLFDVNAELVIVGAVAGLSGSFRNGPELREMFASGFRRMKLWPSAHNHIVNLESDRTASGVVCAEVKSLKPDIKIVSIGYYNDNYVRAESREWKFSRREFHGEA